MKKQYTDKSNIQIKNREINFKYEIIDKIECGIELKGTEVKSIRDGMCNLKDSFALIRNGEIMLKNMHVSPYDHGNRYNTDPLRDRKLLVHKKEVLKLLNYIKQPPLYLYHKINYMIFDYILRPSHNCCFYKSFQTYCFDNQSEK